MKIIIIITTILLTVTCAGCGSRNFYEGFRIQQEMECQKLQRPEQDECLRRSGMSYDEYQKQLKERQVDK